MGGVDPDFREFSLADVAQGDMTPELIGVDGAVPTDTGDTDTGTVAAVHLQ